LRRRDQGEGAAIGNVSLSIAEFVAGLQKGKLDRRLVLEAKRSILNHVAAGFGGAREPEISAAVAILADKHGPAPAIGRMERFRPLDAAFINAALANVQDFDDTHLATIIHPAAPVAPALFALAAETRISGLQLAEAFAVGCEVACRVGLAATPAHYRDGYHITSTCGILGAAMAVGHALGFNADRLVDALGIAVNQSAGLIGSLGQMSKCVSVGNAARNGLFAALMTRAGVKGPADPLGGPHGFFAVMCRTPEPALLISDLGTRWEALRNTYKPYPCGIVVHAVIDACLELAGAHDLAPAAVAAIEVSGHPLLLERTDRPDVTTGREAQVSLQHAAAAAIFWRAAGLSEFSDAALSNPDVAALRAKVTASADPAMPVGAARVRIVTVAGKTFEAFVEHARGSEARPLSNRELTEKLRLLADGKSPKSPPAAIAAAILDLDQAADARMILEMTAATI